MAFRSQRYHLSRGRVEKKRGEGGGGKKEEKKRKKEIETWRVVEGDDGGAGGRVFAEP